MRTSPRPDQLGGPVPPRPAASVVLVRPRADGWATCLLKRAEQSATYAGLWVFPGGLVRPDDATPPRAPAGLTPQTAHARLARPPDQPPATAEESLALFVCAARELLEEAGVLLVGVRSEPTPSPHPAPARIHEARVRTRAGTALTEAVGDLGVELALDQLLYYARWITPEMMPQRFDTRFFLAQLPSGQEVTPDGQEVTEARWVTAQEALAQADAGELPLHFVTRRHLQRFLDYPRLDHLIAFLASKPVVPVTPTTHERDGRMVPALPAELEGAW